MTQVAEPIVVTVGFTSSRGGAGRATANFIRAASACRPGSFAVMAETGPNGTGLRVRRLLWWLGRLMEHAAVRLVFHGVAVKHSINLFTEPKIADLLAQDDPDRRIHLHWIANDTVSLGDLKRLPSGTLITLHDEWIYLGCAHYDLGSIDGGIRVRGPLLGGLAAWLDRWTRDRKRRALSHRRDITVIAPTQWMKRRARTSGMFDQARFAVIPNGIDTVTFAPDAERRVAFRRELGCTADDFLLCFGADQSGRNPIKGTDILISLLERMAGQGARFAKVVVVLFGGVRVQDEIKKGIRVIELSSISDRERLADLYRASDVCLHLSKLEAFGLVPCEAMACGTPVICFDNSGSAELVVDGETGRVCPAFDITRVAEAVFSLMTADAAARDVMRAAARRRVVAEFSLDRLNSRYCELLKEGKGRQ